MLGVRPLFCMASKRHSHGLVSALMHACMIITDASSSTSTDPKLMSCCFYELGNLALNGVHSRDAFCHGFVVNNSNGCGMTARHKSSTDLNKSVDSHVVVKNLAMSQKYIKRTIFLTDTCSHKDRPGIENLSKWKASKEWTEAIPNYGSMLSFDNEEF